MKYTGRKGTLRIYDSAEIIDTTNGSCFVLDNSGPTYTEKTTEAEADDTSYTGTFWVDDDDKIYIGLTSKFAMIQFVKGGGAYAAGSGVLVGKYYNGTAFVALSGLADGTSDGTDCLAQDGHIGFKIPIDWALQGNAALDATKYYIELSPTTTPSTEPSADILIAVDGQYRDIAFAKMDFSGPIGRPKTDELLVLDRGTHGAHSHYIEGDDAKIYEPLDITFSFLLDDVVNKTYIFTALQCGNCNDSANWTTTGTTAKATTKNDGTNLNPAFVDATKKAVNIQILFDGATYDEGWAYYECYFPDSEQSLSESDEEVSVSCKGACYGVIERIHAFGVRY
jgi:hypothetical protein